MSAPDDFDLTRASSPAGDRSSSSDPFEKLEGSEYATSSSADGPARVRRRPIPRKGHTKSRNGCFNCKRRKIKCPENIPECFNCKRLGMSCEYPPANKLTVAALSGPLGVTPVTFNMDDMRFFQHFILTAYPPLPLGGDAVWKDVTAMSHQYEFLIHSMLALAASHLDCCTGGTQYSRQAVSHRLSAISGLNAAMAKPSPTKADGEALFAAVMALAFQACLMDDGMLEFLAMMRGCQIVATAVIPDFMESIFRSFALETHIENAQKQLRHCGAPAVEDELVEMFLASLRGVAPLCRSMLELKYLAAIERVARLPKADPAQALVEFTSLYTMTNDLSNEDFTLFTAPDNWVAQLLLMHLFMLEHVLGETILGPPPRAYKIRRIVTFKWLEKLAERLPTAYQKQIQWLRTFALSVQGKNIDTDQHLQKRQSPTTYAITELH